MLVILLFYPAPVLRQLWISEQYIWTQDLPTGQFSPQHSEWLIKNAPNISTFVQKPKSTQWQHMVLCGFAGDKTTKDFLLFLYASSPNYPL